MRRLTLVLSLALLVYACSSGDGTAPGPSGSIQVAAPRTDMAPGESVQLTWQVKDAAGNVQSSQTATFTSSSAAIATVSAAGVVTAVKGGTATITATAGSASGQVTFIVFEGGLVTSTGATIRAYDGAVELVVPAGAVATPVVIRISSTSNPLLDPTQVTGSVYTVTPDTLHFSSPATVRVRFNGNGGPVGLPIADIRLRRFDGAAWVALPSGSADANTTTATATMTAGGLVSAGWVRPSAPCTSPESRQFDFWIGRWNVTENGQPSGISDITVEPGGCAIWERFQSAGIGRSISFYQPSSGKWYQTYVDDAGFRLLLGGVFSNGNMDLLTPPDGGQVHGRTRWSAEGNNARQQVAARTTNGGASYGPPQYDFLYVRR